MKESCRSLLKFMYNLLLIKQFVGLIQNCELVEFGGNFSYRVTSEQQSCLIMYLDCIMSFEVEIVQASITMRSQFQYSFISECSIGIWKPT
jgi:hypothetical protein